MKGIRDLVVKLFILGVGISYLTGCKDNPEVLSNTGFYKHGDFYVGVYESNQAKMNNLIILDKDFKTAYIYKDANNNGYLDMNEKIIVYDLVQWSVPYDIDESQNIFSEYQATFDNEWQYLWNKAVKVTDNEKDKTKKLEKGKTTEILNKISMYL